MAKLMREFTFSGEYLALTPACRWWEMRRLMGWQDCLHRAAHLPLCQQPGLKGKGFYHGRKPSKLEEPCKLHHSRINPQGKLKTMGTASTFVDHKRGIKGLVLLVKQQFYQYFNPYFLEHLEACPLSFHKGNLFGKQSPARAHEKSSSG